MGFDLNAFSDTLLYQIIYVLCLYSVTFNYIAGVLKEYNRFYDKTVLYDGIVKPIFIYMVILLVFYIFLKWFFRIQGEGYEIGVLQIRFIN